MTKRKTTPLPLPPDIALAVRLLETMDGDALVWQSARSLERARAGRDAAMWAAVKHGGKSLREVARAADVSLTTVVRIIERMDREMQPKEGQQPKEIPQAEIRSLDDLDALLQKEKEERER